MKQRKLDESALQAFYHDEFVTDQLRDFLILTNDISKQGTVVDVGGGCGFFAKGLCTLQELNVRVLDMDPKSVATCLAKGVFAEVGDASNPPVHGDESIVCFNLILHHMVTDSEKATKMMQQEVLMAWKGRVKGIFVNEYIYESFIGNVSGWLIYQITKSKILSALGRLFSKVFPAFKANTFGIGVRFRSHDEWVSMFEAVGFHVKRVSIGNAERVAAPLRTLLIKQIRRDSFWLE